MKPTWQPAPLPPDAGLETQAMLKKLPAARAALAEPKGIAATIPSESILLDTLPLQEAKDSPASDSSMTTHDELFQAEVQVAASHSAKALVKHRLVTASYCVNQPLFELPAKPG